MASKKRLTRDDWVQAAIALGTEVGFDKIAVDALAPRLGATRGSFYWHFTDRAELIAAVLDHWEQVATASTIDALNDLEPTAALDALIAAAFGATAEEDAAEWRLISAADDPQIGPVVARVHRQRLAFNEQLLLRLGASAEDAAQTARVAYAAYLGSLALRQLDPDGPNLGPAMGRLLAPPHA
ncbi:MAG: TetR/AcrR family transcriptional regulator [Propionibacteriales bacterium]|nr:TetR/AcrR family transcriptional regulator [Propionibacteriales bacterium]